ncbi:MAG: GDSL-type esterase/lipase family protein [bacterium]|jgi:lysophospholipase L1-like esterase
MTLSPAIALVALAAITLCFGGLGLADRPAQDGARKPSSLVPAARTDEWAIAREKELIRRAKEEKPAKLVFVGDSITQSWEDPGKAAWEKHIAPLGAINLGNSGDRTENVLYRLAQAPLTRLEPEHVFLLIGTNNLGHGTSNAAETLAGVQAVADTLAAQCPKATIHIIEIFPRGEVFNAMRGDILQINQAMRAWVAQRGARFAIHAIGDAFLSPDGTISKDIMPDFLHLTPKAYDMWAQAVVRAVGK